MPEERSSGQDRQKPPPNQDEREARRAQALRDNLKRRKRAPEPDESG
jgi:hypothetical protein